MPTVTVGRFLIQQPRRPPAVAAVAGIVGFIPGTRQQNPTDEEVKALIQKAPGSFISPKVQKGSFTNELTHDSRPFMFNPSEISKSEGWEWGSHSIPGASHPVISGGTGSARTISFSLYLDSDRGRSANRPKAIDSADVPGFEERLVGETSLDLTDEIKWYQRLTYPISPNKDELQRRGPTTALFRFGPLFPGVRVVVRRADVNVIMWTPSLEPMKAIISMVMEEVVQRSRSESDFALGLAEGDNTVMDQVTGSRVVA